MGDPVNYKKYVHSKLACLQQGQRDRLSYLKIRGHIFMFYSKYMFMGIAA